MLTREELLVVYRNLENPKLDQESVINAMAKAVEVALEKALAPTMFWDADDPQEPQPSVHDVLVSIDAKEGSQVEVQRAVGLENMTVKVTGITDFGEYQWEVVDNNPLSAKAIETILTKKILLGRSWDSNSDQQDNAPDQSGVALSDADLLEIAAEQIDFLRTDKHGFFYLVSSGAHVSHDGLIPLLRKVGQAAVESPNTTLDDDELLEFAVEESSLLYADKHGYVYLSATGAHVDRDQLLALFRKVEQASIEQSRCYDNQTN